MHILLILAIAVLYPATHILNGWLFDFAIINEHISLIYMPAFLRLFNLLILGPLFGTLATILGGLLLTTQFNEHLGIQFLNVACSSAGPLMALIGFKIYWKRQVQLTSLQDLAALTLIYCAFNSVIHHVTWVLIGQSQSFALTEVFWMFLGDLNGALLGAYLMKAILDYREKKGFKFSGF